MKTILSFICIFCFLNYRQPISAFSNTDSKRISASEQLLLKNYFATLFCKKGFGYTLLGARAGAIELCNCPTPFSSHRSARENIIFNSNKYLLKESKTEGTVRFVTFIHKEKFVEVFNKNKEIFQNELGTSVTGEKLLQKICTSEKHLVDILPHNDELLGIVLGFGKENSRLFFRWTKVISSLLIDPLPYPNVFRFAFRCEKPEGVTLQKIEPSSGFLTLEEEQNWFAHNFSEGSYRKENVTIFDLIYPLGFRVKKSAETIDLVKKYAQCKKLLTKLFSERDPVEVVFEYFKEQNSRNVMNFHFLQPGNCEVM